MAIESTHGDYDAVADIWQLVRDCLGGASRMRKHADRYIPRLYKQSADEYSNYVQRAVFFNACKRTLQAFVGFIYRQNPDCKTDNNPEMKAFLDDATMTGKPFYDYGKDTVREALSVGRRATVIDWQLVPEDRAYIVHFETEDIINWNFGRVNNKTMLTRVVLHEEIESEDGKCIDQWREFELLQDRYDDGTTSEPFVRVQIYQRRGSAAGTEAKRGKQPPTGEEKTVVDSYYPNRRGKPLNQINIVFHGAEENSVCPGSVPLEDIAHVNVAHFRNSADYENALHVCGVPTPIAAGFDDDTGEQEGAPRKELVLGANTAWVTPKADAKAYFLSYNGNDAAPLKGAMEDKEKQMAALGARMLEQQGSGKGQEAFETVQIRQSGDMSALMTTTITSSQGLGMVLKWVTWWQDPKIEDPADIPDDRVHYELNTEFLQRLMDAPMLTAIVSAFLQDVLSEKEMYQQLQKGGLIPSEKSFEEHKKEVAQNPKPTLPAAVGPDGKPLDGSGAPGKSQVPTKKKAPAKTSPPA